MSAGSVDRHIGGPMNYTDLLGWCEAYELSIEPIHANTLLRKYTHMIVVKRNGMRIDVGQVVYLALTREMGITDGRGQLSWYRSGAAHRTESGVVEARILPFTAWLYETIEQLRTYLLEIQGVEEQRAVS